MLRATACCAGQEHLVGSLRSPLRWGRDRSRCGIRDLPWPFLNLLPLHLALHLRVWRISKTFLPFSSLPLPMSFLVPY